jgi:hypothetical protein
VVAVRVVEAAAGDLLEHGERKCDSNFWNNGD